MEALTRADKTERFVDFERIIPTPDGYENEGCSHNHPFENLFGSAFDLDPKIDEHPLCWYPWNIEHWGTKWNAYDSQITEFDTDTWEVRFDTAWSHPGPVVMELSKRFPKELIYVKFADEDLGNNVGAYVIQDGKMDHAPVIEGSDEALDLASEIKFGRPYAEVREEWDNDQIEWARRQLWAKELGVEMNDLDLSLPVPAEIIAKLPDIEAVHAYWESSE